MAAVQPAGPPPTMATFTCCDSDIAYSYGKPSACARTNKGRPRRFGLATIALAHARRFEFVDGASRHRDSHLTSAGCSYLLPAEIRLGFDVNASPQQQIGRASCRERV